MNERIQILLQRLAADYPSLNEEETLALALKIISDENDERERIANGGPDDEESKAIAKAIADIFGIPTSSVRLVSMKTLDDMPGCGECDECKRASEAGEAVSFADEPVSHAELQMSNAQHAFMSGHTVTLDVNGHVVGHQPDPSPVPSVPQIMEMAGATFATRNAEYKNSYKEAHKVFMALFPEGLTLKTEADWMLFAPMFYVVSKMQRFAGSFAHGGHIDSAHDSGVYSFMLEEVARIIKAQKEQQ